LDTTDPPCALGSILKRFGGRLVKVREYRSNIHSDTPFDMPTFGPFSNPDPQGIGEMPSSPDARPPIFFRNPWRIATLQLRILHPDPQGIGVEIKTLTITKSPAGGQSNLGFLGSWGRKRLDRHFWT